MKRNIETVTIAALILQLLTVLASLVVIIMQKRLLPLVSSPVVDVKTMVYPMQFFFMISQLIICMIFWSISNKEEDESNRTLGIVLIVISVALAIVAVVANMVATLIYARMGVEILSVYASVSTLISYINTVFGIPAAALFYIALGRYTIKRESTEEP